MKNATEKAVLPPRRARTDWPTGAFGGNIAEVPKPHVRFYANSRRKRSVELNITRFAGFGVHYYATVQEVFDPVWDGRPEHGCWRECWDDAMGKGQRFSEVFNTPGAAERWLRQILAKHFPKRSHKYRRANLGRLPRRWIYPEHD